MTAPTWERTAVNAKSGQCRSTWLVCTGAAHALVNQYDAKLAAATPAARAALREEANTAIAAMLQEKAADTLDKVLFELCGQMKNAFARSDA